MPFVSVEHMMGLVHHLGTENVLRALADEIENDFKRWKLFGKTPRVASHSDGGVIVGEPSMMRGVTGRKGGIGFQVHVRGHEVHSSMMHEGVSAVMIEADLVKSSALPK